MAVTETIDQTVRRHATERRQTVAVVDPTRSLTWSELDESADRLAGQLAADGVRPGDRVAYTGPNTALFPITVLAAWRCGASIIGLNHHLPSDDLRAITADIGLAHAVVHADVIRMREHLSVRGVTVVEDGDPISSAPIATPHVWDDDAEALIYFTSGSTGRPKAVPLTHAAVESAAACSGIHDFTQDTRALILPPNFHAAGSTWTCFSLHAGACMVYSDDGSPAGIVRTLADQEISHAILVPTMIHSVLEELKSNPRELPAMRHVAYGASPITQHLLHEALELLRCDFCQVYGLTESGGAASYLPPADHVGPNQHRLSSAGIPLPGFAVSVRDPEGDETPTGEPGELWFRGPSLTKGYLNDPEATARVLVDGWLNTHDVGYVDDDGYIYIQGRSDDLIQTGGENVHPGAVEEVLATIASIEEAAVFALPDPHWGQQVTAAVVTSSPVSQDEVISYCRERLAPYQVPKAVVFVDRLPRTASGKVQRKVLAADLVKTAD